MEETGERQIPSNPGTLENLDILHTQRYEWASPFTFNKRVYDVACGVGYGSLLLKASEYSGFDNSAEAVDYAKKYYATSPSINFFQADACAMPETLAVADVIVSFETIEHLKDPKAFLGWCSHHGKTLLISSPIRNSFGRSPFHLFEYRLQEFTDVLNKYFAYVQMYVQKHHEGIKYPCNPEEKGVAVAVCQI